MYAQIILSSYRSSDIIAKNSTHPAFGLFIQNRVKNWPGRNRRALIDHIFLPLSLLPILIPEKYRQLMMRGSSVLRFPFN